MEWISKNDFDKIEVGDQLKFRFMIGNNKVTKKPYISKGNECVMVDFTTGPWANKNAIEIIRQQVKSLK